MYLEEKQHVPREMKEGRFVRASWVRFGLDKGLEEIYTAHGSLQRQTKESLLKL